MTSKKIRQQFLDFFASRQHEIVDSSPVVPHDDPTLMFTNAGMNQFKDVFMGTGSRSYTRAVDTQKCIRAGGKHNDLDDVGQDTYHHTFFEMLGNWSFGDYFKKEAIEWAWELLTGVWGIEKDRLHATYFEGDEAEGLEPDTEAAELWKTVTDIDPSHIHPGNKKDNFWEMGDTGPCGPCSEIHIDLTPDKSGASLVNAGDARVIELWNLVFIQFNRASDGKLTPLPAKHVDTGMGFERLTAVLHGMETNRLGQVSNYDTDLFSPIFEAIQKRTGAPEYSGTLPTDEATALADKPPVAPNNQSSPDVHRDKGADEHAHASVGMAPHDKKTLADPDASGPVAPGVDITTNPSPERERRVTHDQIMVDVSYRVIADHIRCLTFALTDGAIPSNEGRGYVLRSILRRAVYFGRQFLDMHEPFLCDLIESIIQHMVETFPELENSAFYGKRNANRISEIIRDEEVSFFKTYDSGIILFAIAKANAIGSAYAELQGNLKFMGVDSYAYWEREDIQPEWQKATRGLNFVNKDNNTDKCLSTEKAYKTLQGAKVSVNISGKDAFKLHDTYGFPIDLTQLMAEECGLSINIDEYTQLMEEARDKARGISRDLSDPFDPSTYEVLTKGKTTCDDMLKYIEPFECEAFIWSLGSSQGFLNTDRVTKGDKIIFNTNRTPFYAEQGGQVSDIGTLETDDGAIVEVVDVIHRKLNIVHRGVVKCGTIPMGSTCQLRVNYQRRAKIMKNHTSTHIMNWALRKVLEIEQDGDIVNQRGSLVDPDKTRFDFSHNKPLTDDELNKIETLVNDQIKANLTVYTQNNEEDYIDQKEARKINTLRAVFGEKYSDRVRVVSIGAPVTEEDARKVGEKDWLLRSPDDPKWMQYSVEFCGGTHLQSSKEAEHFVIVSEEGVAKGIRRVVGISGDAASKAETLGQQLLDEVTALADPDTSGPVAPIIQTPDALTDPNRDRKEAAKHAGASLEHATQNTLPKNPSPERERRVQDDLGTQLSAFQQKLNEAVIPIRVRHQLRDAITELQKKVKVQQKQVSAASGEAAMQIIAKLFETAETVGGVTVVVGEIPTVHADALRGAIDWVRNKTQSSAVFLVTSSDDKVTLIAGMSKTVVSSGVKAGDLIKEIAPIVGGRGGGRPDMAQGGGNDPTKIPEALERAKNWFKDKLS